MVLILFAVFCNNPLLSTDVHLPAAKMTLFVVAELLLEKLLTIIVDFESEYFLVSARFLALRIRVFEVSIVMSYCTVE